MRRNLTLPLHTEANLLTAIRSKNDLKFFQVLILEFLDKMSCDGYYLYLRRYMYIFAQGLMLCAELTYKVLLQVTCTADGKPKIDKKIKSRVKRIMKRCTEGLVGTYHFIITPNNLVSSFCSMKISISLYFPMKSQQSPSGTGCFEVEFRVRAHTRPQHFQSLLKSIS